MITPGTYHFTSTAFVNKAQFGFKLIPADFTKLRFSDTYYCTAPVVATASQTQALYWVIGKDCCTTSTTKCWVKYSSPGSVTGAFALTRSDDILNGAYGDARVAASLKLAQTSNSTAAELVALPSVFVELSSDPDAVARSYRASGFAFSVIMALLWPLVWLAIGGTIFVYASRPGDFSSVFTF
jgi:hypothetical protein